MHVTCWVYPSPAAETDASVTGDQRCVLFCPANPTNKTLDDAALIWLRDPVDETTLRARILIQNKQGRKKYLSVHTIRKARSEEHTSELQSLMRISYAVFCLKKKNK